jgi:biotin synthase
MKMSELTLDRDGLAAAIACEDAAFEAALREEAYRVKVATVGPEVYLRGLIEISNICAKNCLYCGIRRDIRCQRYELSEEEVLATARVAASRRFGSVVIQGGERGDAAFVRKITRLLKEIKSIDTGEDPPLGVTLSLGEQPREVYEEWFDAGAHRYLLRIESSNPDLYYKIHPNDSRHSYDRRLQALYDLKEIGYQAGTGAMIGMPFQTAEDMADDLLFYKKFDAPMIGMGPYNPHPETPLTLTGAAYPSAERRFALGLKMIALLRLLMPDINIAAATALEVLDPRGREKGLLSGANVIMPNITPEEQMVKYNLYDRKTLNASDVKDLSGKGIVIGYGRWGDSKHFRKE